MTQQLTMAHPTGSSYRCCRNPSATTLLSTTQCLALAPSPALRRTNCCSPCGVHAASLADQSPWGPNYFLVVLVLWHGVHRHHSEGGAVAAVAAVATRLTTSCSSNHSRHCRNGPSYCRMGWRIDQSVWQADPPSIVEGSERSDIHDAAYTIAPIPPCSCGACKYMKDVTP